MLERPLDTAVPYAMPPQDFDGVLGEEEIRASLAELHPKAAWCHYYRFATGLESVTPANGQYYLKALSGKVLATQLRQSIPYILRSGSLAGKTVLDLACAEGQHAVELAAAGAKHILGVEGRKLYVDRARFAARCFGLANLEIVQGDVRTFDPKGAGPFDLVLFYGILHHLGPDDFAPMLRRLRGLTGETLVLFTHTAALGAEPKFGHRLSAPMTNEHGYTGRLYREHPDGMSEADKEKRLRSSIDNNFSFWAREDELLRAILDAGFLHVSRQLAPNPFAQPVEDFRVVYICRT